MITVDLLRCAFLRKLSVCMRNVAVFCQHLLRPITAVLADAGAWVKPKYRPIYRPGQYIGRSLIFISD